MNYHDIQQAKLKNLVNSAISYCRYTHIALFEENNPNVAIGYLNCAASKIAAAEALYYVKIEEFEHSDIERVFDKFDAFAKELLCNIEMEHSYQGTDIDFHSLMNAFEGSVCY